MVRVEESVIYLWKKVWRFSKGNRHKVGFYVALSVIANLISFMQPLVLAKLINVVQVEGISQANLPKLLFIASFFIFTIIGFWLFHGPSRIIERENAFFVRAKYKQYLVDGVLTMPPEWHAEHHTGDTIDKIEKGTRGLYNFAGGTFEVVETIIRFVSSAIALFYFNLVSGFFVVFFVIIAVLLVLRFDNKIKVYFKEINKAENQTAQKIFDFISNMTTVIILRIEKIASSEIWKKINAPFNTYRRNLITVELKWALVSLASASMIFTVISSYLVREALVGEVVLVGTLIALYQYVDRISGLFFRFAYRYGDILTQRVDVENAEELAKDFVTKHKDEQIKMKNWKELQIENLTFSYNVENTNKNIHIDNLSMKIKRGEKIALIGDSGSGKTTLLKLLRGLYRPETVKIQMANNNAKSILIPEFDLISDSMSLIPQEPELFTATIRENITMGIECDEATLNYFMNAACFISVVEKLPNGLDSSIKEKGVNLSGGEKQRLALCRGLLASRDKEIIMLDEPTSSVDSRNEMNIYKNIFALSQGKTVISSIHRLHLLPLFDTIYYFEKGKIIASGTLNELLERSPQFRKLWDKYHRTQKTEAVVAI
jgi:ATP-binding cassette, subfamily B, bacterial